MSRIIVAFVSLFGCSTMPNQGDSIAMAHGNPLRTPVILLANANIDPYAHIKSALFVEPETPDCAHSDFGPHITQALDPDLGQEVFLFHAHVHPDSDRCINADRQRVEIKTSGGNSTPAYLKWANGERLRTRWLFKISSAFKPSTHFTHLHQIKDSGLENGDPVMTLTARKKSSGDRLEVSYISNIDENQIVLKSIDLNLLRGNWIEANEDVTFGSHGKYAITLKRVSDQQQILTYTNANIDTWRTHAPVMRPKWGIYRSLLSPEQLNDETVAFSGFCIAKGDDDCALAW